jgi:hypothetical protein
MLATVDMTNLLSTYAEFSNPPSAERAVRALKAAGFDNIETEDLSHGLQTSTDNWEAPFKATVRFSVAGALLGAILGIGWGLLVFGIPVMVLDVPYGAVVMLVGLCLCIGVGGIIGMEQFYVIAGRAFPDPTSTLQGHPVGVRVCVENGASVMRAREILHMFNEESKPREERWWRLRSWARALGT